jgi:hypothetical protein
MNECYETGMSNVAGTFNGRNTSLESELQIRQVIRRERNQKRD